MYFFVTFAVTFYQMTQEFLSEKTRVFRELNEISRSFNASYAKALWEYNAPQVTSINDGLIENNLIIGVKILDSDQEMVANKGKVVFEKDEERITRKKLTENSVQQINQKNKGMMFASIYEYEFAINYNVPEGGISRVGTGYIYTNESVMVERVKDSFILIIINSLIKTAALWIIFLAMTHKLIIRPIQKLTANLSLYDPNKPKKFKIDDDISSRNDELGSLSMIFQNLMDSIIKNLSTIYELNQDLEKKVEDRTKELREKKRHIESIFKSMPVGILTLGKGGIIGKEYSPAVLKHLGLKDDIAGKSIKEVFFDPSMMPQDDSGFILAAINTCIGETDLNFNLNFSRSNVEVDFNVNGRNRSFDLSWAYVANDDLIIEKIMLCITDVSEIKALALKSEEQQKEIKIISEVLGLKQKNIKDCFKTVRKLMKESHDSLLRLKNRAAFKRSLHTLKGTTRMFGLSFISDKIHETESYLETIPQHETIWKNEVLSTHMKSVMSIYKQYFEKAREYGNLKNSGIGSYQILPLANVDFDRIMTIYKSADTKKSANIDDLRNVISILTKSKYLPLDSLLESAIDSLEKLAKDLNKPSPEIHFDSDKILWNREVYSLMNSVFAHIFSNSLDHGIEGEKRRIQKGKPANGNIFIKVEENASNITLTYYDDGSGLPLEKVRQQALDLDLLPEAEKNPTTIAETIFSAGFSTKSGVSQVSGRGIGLDAVKALIEEEDGSVSIELESSDKLLEFVPFKLVFTLPCSFIYKEKLHADVA